MHLLRLSISQVYGQIGIDTHNASQSMESPRGELSIEQQPAEMSIEQPSGQLQVDSTEAWNALGEGPHLQFMSNIYSQSSNLALQGIAKKVEEGNRMAQITNGGNAFADIAYDNLHASSPINYLSDASNLNVKLNYEAQAAIINIEPQKAKIEYTPRKPEIQYNPGSVEIYMKQQNSIDINVSEYNFYK
ncbi:DUF6470 family protein [Paenibacillus alba]|uniref:DUF6470 family protein n=1 Tax=Paenibacillus alba TaxID=1197127 RepID=A0ABU6G536_9BACL|nr:DUF6470 family protein [Paenibacillus alba]MEC0227889.1 DUF6470 family protein [Paenibacillus alba]